MQSDPWWSLAMAVNVYMVFFLAANPNSFRQYLWIYSLVCFGAPALPALICLILRKDSRGIYGNATVGCFGLSTSTRITLTMWCLAAMVLD